MGRAVSAYELLGTRDCRSWRCTREATTSDGLCGYCARVAALRHREAALAWRRLVRTFDPPAGSGCSGLTFQAVASALAELLAAGAGSPSIAELVRASRASERTVQQALAALEALGLIVRDRRGGRGRPSRYALKAGPSA